MFLYHLCKETSILYPKMSVDNILKSLFHLFFFNDTATTEIYTLSLHDALPIYAHLRTAQEDHSGSDADHPAAARACREDRGLPRCRKRRWRDRKSTRLNSSHPSISYAVFCLKKKTSRCSFTISAKRLLSFIPR